MIDQQHPVAGVIAGVRTLGHRHAGAITARPGEIGAECTPGRVIRRVIVDHGGARLRLDGLAQALGVVVHKAAGQAGVLCRLAGWCVLAAAGDRQRFAEGVAGEARERGCGCTDLHRRIGDGLIEGLVRGFSRKTARVGDAGAEAGQVLGGGGQGAELGRSTAGQGS